MLRSSCPAAAQDGRAKVNVFASTTFAEMGSRATDVIDVMVTHGITRIEIGSIHAYEPDLAPRLAAVPAEFLVHNYFPPPPDPFVVNLASLDDRIRDRSLRHALDSLAFCAGIGAPIYTVHPGFLSDPSETHAPSLRNYNFRFEAVPAGNGQAKEAFRRFLAAVRVLGTQAGDLGVQLAVETQGSMSNPHQLLLQTPEEFEEFLAETADLPVGINLNLAHLRLASGAFGFDLGPVLKRLAPRAIAVEVSHHDGTVDEHRPLVDGAWYWSILEDPAWLHIPVILECRDTPIEAIAQGMRKLGWSGPGRP